jgi:hypothetical protein
VSDPELLAQRIDVIERGYEYLLAYAAQGRQDDAGTELRETLARMHEALTAMQGSVSLAFGDLPLHAGTASVHVRALLTDLFLIEQALKSPAA